MSCIDPWCSRQASLSDQSSTVTVLILLGALNVSFFIMSTVIAVTYT